MSSTIETITRFFKALGAGYRRFREAIAQEAAEYRQQQAYEQEVAARVPAMRDRYAWLIGRAGEDLLP